MSAPFSEDGYQRLQTGWSGLNVWQASTRASARQGLLGRDSLPAGTGLLLRSNLVHMLGMRFALDLVFCDRRGRVLRVVSDVPPGLRLRGCPRARYTLELAAGQAEKLGLQPGVKLALRPTSA